MFVSWSYQTQLIPFPFAKNTSILSCSNFFQFQSINHGQLIYIQYINAVMGACSSTSDNRYFEDQVFHEFFDKLDQNRSKELQQRILSKYKEIPYVAGQTASQEIQKQQKISIQLFFELVTRKETPIQLNEAEQIIIQHIGGKYYKQKHLTLDIMLYSQKDEEGRNMEQKVRVIVIGITGVGKSSFINTFANFIENEDQDFENGKRYKAMVVDKSASSQTRICNSYTFRTLNGFIIELIDTPGLCDTNGDDSDLKNLEAIEECLLKKGSENYLDFVIFVSNSRFMEKYRKNDMSNLYIQTKIQEVLKFIPKEMQDRILHIITFSDFSPLNMDFYLNNSIFQPQFDKRSNPQSYFFQFENSVIYCNANTQLNRLQYLRNKTDHQKLIKKLNESITNKDQEHLNRGRQSNIEAIQSIINSRRDLKRKYQELKEILKTQSQEITKTEVLIRDFSRLEQGLALTSEFTRLVPREVTQQFKLQGSRNNNNCGVCNQTCHPYCTETSLTSCVVIRQEKCMICNHDISVHQFSEWYVYKQFVMETEIVENIKNENKEYEDQTAQKIKDFKDIDDKINQQKRQSQDFIKSIESIVEQLNGAELFKEDLQQQIRKALFQETEFLEYKIGKQIDSLKQKIQDAVSKLKQSPEVQQQQHL